MKQFLGLNKKDSPRQHQGFDAGLDHSLKPQLARGLTNLYSPQITEKSHVRDLADVLAEMGKLSSEQLVQIHQEKSEKGLSRLEQLVLRTGVSEEDILMAKAKLYGFEFRRIKAQDVDKEAFEKLDLNYIRNNHIIPVSIEDGTLVVATSEPANVFVIDDVKRHTGLDMRMLVCSEEDINVICNEFDDSKFGYDVDELISDMADIEVVSDNEAVHLVLAVQGDNDKLLHTEEFPEVIAQ